MKLKVLLFRRIPIASLLLLFSLNIYAQSFPVSGKVTSTTGEPLAGVTVQVKNGTATTTTGADGTFRINAPSANAALVFTYVGFGEQQVSVNNKNQLSVSMTPSNASLENVAVCSNPTSDSPLIHPDI